MHVAREYGASKGLLQTLQSASSTFAGMVTVFCNRLGWKNLELLLSQFQSRLAFGIERELCDLVAISLLNGFRARALYNAGFHSLSALATANPLAIECCLRNAVPFRSSKANEEELQQRSSTWCAKLRKGMTEFEAAKEIVHEAQKILSEELNIPLETWKLIQLSNQQKPSKFCNSSSTKPIATKTTRNSNLKDGKGIKRLCLREIKQKRLSQVDQFDSHGKGLVTHPNENLNPPNAGEEIFKQKEETDIPVSKVPPNEHKSLKFNSSDVLNVAITRVSTGQTSHSVVIEDSISYSPILSLDASAHSRRSFSHSLLNTPLPLEPFKSSSPPLSPLPSRELGVHEESLRKSPPSSSNHPPAITSSFPSSMNMSVSFSCHTFALIDAACNGSDGKEEVDQVMSNDMSCSLISGTGECSLQEEMILKIAESFNCHNNASDVAKVDGLPPIPFSGSPCFEPTPHGNQPKLQFGTTPHENQISKLQSELTPHENQVPKLQFGTTPYENRVPKLQSEPTPRENQVPKLQATCKSPLASIDFPSQSLKDLSSVCNSQTSLSQSGACIIDVASNPLLFETFLSECQEQNSIAFSIATSSTAGQGSCIGSKIVPPTKAVGIPIPRQNDQVTGLAFCWGDMNVYYVSLCQVSEQRDKTSIPLATRFKGVCNVFQNRSTHLKELTAYSMKKHVKVLAATFKTLPAVTLMDPTVADWMLDPDGKEKTIHKMVLHYLPDQPVLSEGDDYEEMSLSSLASHASDPRMRSSAEVLLASLLMSKTKALLESENLFQSFLKVEMPSLMILAKMELNGIGFSKEECEILKQILQQRLLQLERDAYALAQRTFSLTSPEDVAQVLFLELKLPCPDSKQQKSLGPNRRGRKKVQHLSTAKEVLEKLKLLHPLPGIVLEWRRISSTVTKMVFPLFKDAVHCDTLNSLRVHPTYQIHTATGRVAASDPNLQMVPKEYDIGPNTDIRSMLNSEDLASATAGVLLSESQCLKTACQTDKKDDKVEISSQDYPHPPCSSVCMRSVFTSFPGGVYLAADYSQLELRVLAHMSGDSKLQKFLNSDGDVFKMIAGEWLGIPSSEVSAKDRQSAKQVCYGMIYGIGAKALAEQLGISNDEATKFMNTFKSKYPAVKTFISSTVQSCKESGHIVTLLGRKRFLPAIHSKNIHACSQAERQAVNSTIQGSAADLVKTAMVNIDTALVDVFKHAPPCLTLPEHSHIGEVRGAYLVLQLHDELLYEVCEKDLVQVAGIVKYHMENALQLSVKFPVKIKSGASWGNLQELSI